MRACTWREAEQSYTSWFHYQRSCPSCATAFQEPHCTHSCLPGNPASPWPEKKAGFADMMSSEAPVWIWEFCITYKPTFSDHWLMSGLSGCLVLGCVQTLWWENHVWVCCWKQGEKLQVSHGGNCPWYQQLPQKGRNASKSWKHKSSCSSPVYGAGSCFGESWALPWALSNAAGVQPEPEPCGCVLWEVPYRSARGNLLFLQPSSHHP